jgi:hypothetical protein
VVTFFTVAISLETLFPSPPARYPTTAMIREYPAPSSGVRQQMGAVSVPAVCKEGYCKDGIFDAQTGREILPITPSPDEREILGAPGDFVDAVRLTSVDDRWISAYLGQTEYSGGAHSNNELECAVFDRRTGRRVELQDVVGKRRARVELRRAQRLLDAQNEPFHVDPRSFRLDPVNGGPILCALYFQGGIILEL